MHPVARVSTNILIRTTVRNKYFSCSILFALLQHVSAPIGDHLQVKCTQKNIFIVTTVYLTDPLSQLYKGKCHSQVSQINVL
jgi:hypothetical protein